jgi:hypothetical protein
MLQKFQNRLKYLVKAFFYLWEFPLTATLFALILYLGIAACAGRLNSASPFDYYNYLADAFLHGQFSLRILPQDILDLSVYQGNYYLNWGPFPAVLCMPFVAIFGIHFNDVLFTGVIAAANIGLFSVLLRKTIEGGILKLTKSQRGLLVFFLALGTVHITLASKGKVWQTAQIVAFCFTILTYISAISFAGKKAWFFTGLMLTLAMLSRVTTLFVGIFPLAYLIYRDKDLGWKPLWANFLLAASPLVLGLIFLGYYNWARFGNLYETGLSFHLMNNFFTENYQQYGISNPHYFLTNLYYEYIYYPLPVTEESFMGGSLFLLSPLFCAIFPAIFRGKPRWVVWTLLASILVTNLPIMFHMSTGWVTFGPRYTLDFSVPLLILTGMGIEKWNKWVSGTFVLASIIQYAIGNLALLHLW